MWPAGLGGRWQCREVEEGGALRPAPLRATPPLPSSFILSSFLCLFPPPPAPGLCVPPHQGATSLPLTPHPGTEPKGPPAGKHLTRPL